MDKPREEISVLLSSFINKKCLSHFAKASLKK